MKKTFQLCVLLFMVATLLSSCKEDKKEWSYMYGYNREDVLGNYTFSNIPKAFDGLEENVYCHICDSAMVSITSSGEKSILFELNSPSDNVFRVFNGLPSLTPNDFMIDMLGSWTSLSSSRLRRNSVTAYGMVSKRCIERSRPLINFLVKDETSFFLAFTVTVVILSDLFEFFFVIKLNGFDVTFGNHFRGHDAVVDEQEVVNDGAIEME